MSNLGRSAQATGDARRSLAMAREIGYPAGEVLVLGVLSFAAVGAGCGNGSMTAWLAGRVGPAGGRWRSIWICSGLRGRTRLELRRADILAGQWSQAALIWSRPTMLHYVAELRLLW